MSRHIEARFEIASWDETPFEDGDDATKLILDFFDDHRRS